MASRSLLRLLFPTALLLSAAAGARVAVHTAAAPGSLVVATVLGDALALNATLGRSDEAFAPAYREVHVLGGARPVRRAAR